jgi:hypothetical protein
MTIPRGKSKNVVKLNTGAAFSTTLGFSKMNSLIRVVSEMPGQMHHIFNYLSTISAFLSQLLVAFHPVAFYAHPYW